MITFWFDPASTYSYPVAMRIEALARQYGVAVTWRPFLLGPIFREQGWTDSPFNLYAAKGRYMWRDLERVCAGLQIPFRKPSAFPRNGLRAARVACAGADEPWVPEFVRRLYTANFAQDRDIADPAVLLDLLLGLVADPQAILTFSEGEAPKAALRTNTQRAIELGIFGAPSFTVGEELFWGNDRLDAAIAWCKAARAPD